jgi:ComF family protein
MIIGKTSTAGSKVLQQMRHGISHLFYPRLCEGCSKPLLKEEEILCVGCCLQLPEIGDQQQEDNEAALRFAGRIPFVGAAAYAYFTTDGLLQHLLHGLKYGGKQEIGMFLGRQLGGVLKNVGWISSVDMIIPVPLHKAKQASRGYNQSLLIAQGISEKNNIPVNDGVLYRVKDTESQTHKTRAQRIDNMEGAFALRNMPEKQGKHILICDDVLTTGATLEACALALLQGNEVKISLATIGIAVG